MQRGEGPNDVKGASLWGGGGGDKLSETAFLYFKSSKVFCFQMVYFIFLLFKMTMRDGTI